MQLATWRKTSGYALLLFLFGIGAFAAVLWGKSLVDRFSRFEITQAECVILLLGLDVSQIGSLCSRITLPVLTLLFGAAAAMEGMQIWDPDTAVGRRQLFLLLAAVPIHFFLCVWGMNLTAEMFRILKGRKGWNRVILISALLMLSGFVTCTWLICSFKER